MTLPISLSGSATLATLCNHLRTAAAGGQHEQHELRATPTSLYIKLRSAGCMSRSIKSRTAHQRAVHVLLQGRLETSLQALGASNRTLGVMESVLPVPIGASTRPVRVSDVYALERCVARIEKLIHTHGLRPAQAVDLAIAFQQVHNQQLVDDDMLREAARHLENDDECPASFAAYEVFKARATSHALTSTAQAGSEPQPRHTAPRAVGEMVLTLPAGLFAQEPQGPVASPADGKHATRAEAQAPLAREFESRLPRSYDQRAHRLLELAREIRATPPGAQAAQELSELYAQYVPLAGSFTSAELLGDDQRQRLERYIQEVQPLITRSAATWSSLVKGERRQVVATLRSAFSRHFESPTLNLDFTRDPPPATISADGATITLGLMPDQGIWRQFDQLVHQLIYGLTLGYHRELARQVTQPDFATRSPQEQALPRIMQALTEVPVERAILKEQLGYRLAAARVAEQTSARRYHANLLADRVAAVAYDAGHTA